MIFASFVPIIIFVFVILLIAGAVKGNSEKGGEDVIKNVYIYLVLFATLMMTIGGSVAAFMALADIYAPSPYYQSFEEYKRWGDPSFERSQEENTEKLTEEQLRANYDAMVASQKENSILQAKNNLIKSFGWIIIPLPIFIYFQRRLVRKNSFKE
jgi:hypothetical protein